MTVATTVCAVLAALFFYNGSWGIGILLCFLAWFFYDK